MSEKAETRYMFPQVTKLRPVIGLGKLFIRWHITFECPTHREMRRELIGARTGDTWEALDSPLLLKDTEGGENTTTTAQRFFFLISSTTSLRRGLFYTVLSSLNVHT